MSLFARTWAQLTPEEQNAFDARLAKIREGIEASIAESQARKGTPPGPAYLRDGNRELDWPPKKPESDTQG